MRKRARFQRDLDRFVRRTDIRSEQIYDKVKDFVETTDELADRICYTLRKVLATTDDTADVLYETMQRILGGDHTLRNRIGGLLELEDLSEEDLEYEIRRFLNAASTRREEGRRFGAEKRIGRVLREAGYRRRVAHEKSKELFTKLEEMLDSPEMAPDEFREKARELIDSFKAKVASAGCAASEASDDLRLQLRHLAENEKLSEDQLKEKIEELVGAFTARTQPEHSDESFPENAPSREYEEERKMGEQFVT